MVAYYVAKIEDEEINPKTGEAWKVEDVPKLWKSKVEAEIAKDTTE